MDSTDLTNLGIVNGAPLDGYLKSFHEASVTGDEDDDSGAADGSQAGSAIQYCVPDSGAGKIKGIWFDRLMADWTGLAARRANGLSATTRIDSFFAKGAEFFLIEFKAVQSLTGRKFNLFRKFYDSLLQLVAHKWLTLADSIAHMTYIVVSTGVPVFTEQDIRKGFLDAADAGQKAQLLLDIVDPVSDYLVRPWKKAELLSKCKLYYLEGVACRKTLTLTPAQFNLFAKEQHWQ